MSGEVAKALERLLLFKFLISWVSLYLDYGKTQ